MAGAGFLTVRRGHGGGTFVQERDTASLIPILTDFYRMAMVGVEELTRTRVILESVVIREAAAKMTSEDLVKLYKNVDQAEEYYRRGDHVNRLETNLEYHSILAGIVGSLVLELNIAAVIKLLSYYLEAIPPSTEMIEATISGHREILRLIENGEVEKAIKLNEAHVEEISKKMMHLADEEANKGLPARHLINLNGAVEDGL